jgi:hypothetical protein
MRDRPARSEFDPKLTHEARGTLLALATRTRAIARVAVATYSRWRASTNDQRQSVPALHFLSETAARMATIVLSEIAQTPKLPRNPDDSGFPVSAG